MSLFRVIHPPRNQSRLCEQSVRPFLRLYLVGIANGLVPITCLSFSLKSSSPTSSTELSTVLGMVPRSSSRSLQEPMLRSRSLGGFQDRSSVWFLDLTGFVSLWTGLGRESHGDLSPR